MTNNEADELLREAEVSASVRVVKPLSGGTHPAWRVDAGQDTFFIKYSNSPDAQELFECEVNGLQVLRRYGKSFRVPETVFHNTNYLILEYIGHGKPTKVSEARAGQALAELHQTGKGQAFGWKTDNFIGPLRQSNRQSDDWMTFFTECRIRPMLKLARHRLSEEDDEITEKLLKSAAARLGSFAPCIVHGDLWSGNLFYDGEGQPVLIDPSVYIGHAEVDLAMTTLFGGFAQDFYTGYTSACRPDDGYEARLRFWNLYPLLVHVVLFGSYYVNEFRSQIRQLLKSTLVN